VILCRLPPRPPQRALARRAAPDALANHGVIHVPITAISLVKQLPGQRPKGRCRCVVLRITATSAGGSQRGRPRKSVRTLVGSPHRRVPGRNAPRIGERALNER
jgi:hypothetical protein